jgi:23S rRNA (adenine2503-C2)-methyltransferase
MDSPGMNRDKAEEGLGELTTGAAAQARALFGMGAEELRAVVEELGLPKYRAVQLGDALYKRRVAALEEITTLPVEVRERLAAEGYGVGLPEIVQAAKSVDGTERYLVRLADGETVETVWMPGGDGGERGDGSEAAVEEEGEVDAEVGSGPTYRDGAAMNGAREDFGDPTSQGRDVGHPAPGTFWGGSQEKGAVWPALVRLG